MVCVKHQWLVGALLKMKSLSFIKIMVESFWLKRGWSLIIKFFSSAHDFNNEVIKPHAKNVRTRYKDVCCESHVTCFYANGHVVIMLVKRGEASHAPQGTKRSIIYWKATTYDSTMLMHPELGLHGR